MSMAGNQAPHGDGTEQSPSPARLSRRARLGADASASHRRTSATRRALEASASQAVHASGPGLVEKSTEGVVQLDHDQHPGFDAHRKGHPVDQEVKSLAHIYQPWANVRVNGSGILAIAAWSQRLKDEGKEGIRSAGKSFDPFIRGLIHR